MKKLLLFLLPLAACTKKPCEPTFTLNGTEWVNVTNAKMAFRFTADSMYQIGNDIQKGIYKATKSEMTLYTPSDTITFKISVSDSVMTWVNYPLPNYAITFSRVK